MKTCDEYQLAIEMKRHGALESSEAAQADQHVAGCSACQGALASASDVEAALRPPVSAHPPRYQEVRRALERDRLSFKYLPWLCVASFVVQGALISVLVAPEDPLRLWGILSAAGVLLALVTAAEFARRRRAVLKAASLGISAWAEHRRKQLRAELRDLRILNFVLPLIGAGMLACAWIFDPSKVGARILFAVVGATVIPFMAAIHAWYRLRLLRERAELGEAS